MFIIPGSPRDIAREDLIGRNTVRSQISYVGLVLKPLKRVRFRMLTLFISSILACAVQRA
jgi:hypothetical protein